MRQASSKITKEVALSKAMKICSTKEMCKSDIRKKNIVWKLPSEQLEEIIDFLIKEKFIDEERFAGFYVKDKFGINKWGKSKIIHQLRSKSLPDDVIKKAISQISDEEYQKTLEELLKRKSSLIKYNSRKDKEVKLLRFAQGRGFELDIILKFVKIFNE